MMGNTKIDFNMSYSDAYKTLMRELITFHLKRMIEDIAQHPDKTFALAETPLKGVCPEEIYSILEDLGWYESECWFDDEYGCATFMSKEWGFTLCLSFNGFEWTANMFRGEDL